MPNWCSNQLNVCGPKTWVDLFKEKITTEEGAFEILDRLYPCPEELKGFPSRHGTIPDDDPDKEQKEANLEKYNAVDWYDWCINNWGTKWGDCDTEFYDDFESNYDGDLKTAMYKFETAWGPPQEGITHISSSFKPLLFDLRFQEPGMAFCGFARIHNGSVLSEQTSDMIMDAHWIFASLEDDYVYELKNDASELDEKEVEDV